MTSVQSKPQHQIDTFMPVADIETCHEIVVHAPANIVFDAAEQFDLLSVPLVRAIFWLRGWIMGAARAPARRPQGLVAETKRLGWQELIRRPGRELVMGAAAQPWLANVTFTPIAPDAFTTYSAPNCVKIVWTLEAMPIEPALTLFRTETRVLATDAAARQMFRRYWRLARFGIWMIRWLHLPALRKAAEQSYRKS